jgi:hypothetical protein
LRKPKRLSNKKLEPESLLRRAVCARCGSLAILGERCERCTAEHEEHLRRKRECKALNAARPQLDWKRIKAYWAMVDSWKSLPIHQSRLQELRVTTLLLAELKACFFQAGQEDYVQTSGSDRLNHLLAVAEVWLDGLGSKELMYLKKSTGRIKEISEFVGGELGITQLSYVKAVADEGSSD